MNSRAKILVVALTLSLLWQTPLLSQERDRSEIGENYKWKLSDLYESDQTWTKAKDDLAAKFDQVLEYKGKLSTSASQLLACLNFNSNLSKEFGRLYSYASMTSDEDTRNSQYQAMKQVMRQLGTDYSAKASFIEPEILKMDKAKIDGFIKKKRGLRIYEFYLHDLLRRKAHTLSEKEEKIMAEAGMLSGAPSSIYSLFSNAELPFPEITLSDGTVAKLNQAGYSRHRSSPNRKDREAVFQAFWNAFKNFKQTTGIMLYSQIKKDMFYARTRNYDSSLHNALDSDNIDVQVYHSLIENVNKNLDTFHRYLNLRKRMLNVDTLKYSDLYAPTVEGVELKYTYDEGKKLILDAMKPLGKKYTRVVKKSFDDRWIDVYPSPGKKMGAYSNGGAYDVHPYILLNYNGKYDDVSTLAHELGHTMHSYYANKTQPYPTADYSTFVAEVASTFNEALLIDKMLKEIKDDKTRLSLLMNYLEGARQTLFRQTQFAEFELRIHEKAERGEPLTGDVLTEMYADIVRRYYGQENGVCDIEDLYTIEWAYIPHFYYNFYVFQYSTSFTASTALAEKVLAKEKGAAKKYIKFLSAGGSDYPINLLKKAGVDMTTAEPFEKTIAAMNRTMDEIEAILKKISQNAGQKP